MIPPVAALAAVANSSLRRVSGVKAIALELDVKLAPDHKRSDTGFRVDD